MEAPTREELLAEAQRIRAQPEEGITMTDEELLIVALRYAGISAKVRHWRVAMEHMPRNSHETPVYYSPKSILKREWHFCPRGGVTVVNLIANRDQFGIPRGEILSQGMARCAMTDQFWRYYGRRLAIERAIRRLQFPTFILDMLALSEKMKMPA